MEINKIIKRRRLELGLTLKDVAKSLGIAESTVSRYESSDIQNMGIDKIEALSKVLKCSPAYLMGWEDLEEELKPTQAEIKMFHENSYENLIISEIKKMNQKGKVKLLDTARDMTCNPLYNENYQLEVNAAHDRTDIEVTEEMKKNDDAFFDED